MTVVAEYTVAAVAAPAVVVALELLVLRTNLLVERRYWLTVAIVLAFQLPVDGWLTHGRPPVVAYATGAISGLRLPMAIPVEDLAFGYAVVTLTLLIWRWHQPRPADV